MVARAERNYRRTRTTGGAVCEKTRAINKYGTVKTLFIGKPVDGVVRVSDRYFGSGRDVKNTYGATTASMVDGSRVGLTTRPGQRTT